MNNTLSIIQADLNKLYPFASVIKGKAEYEGNHENFILLMKEASYQLAGEIQKKTNFCKILEICGSLVREIAIKVHRQSAEKFGTLRNPKRCYDDRIVTPLTGPYKSMIDSLMQINENDIFMNWENFANNEEAGGRTGFRVGIDKNSHAVELSRYILYSGFCTLAHTYPENLGMALQQCDFLYDKILNLNPGVDFCQIYENLARFHWWYIQAAPFFRGTASSGEIISCCISINKFGKLIQWEPGVHVDHIALVSSEEEFVAIYPKLFQLI